METPRPGLEKPGAVRTDPDLIGLLFTLIYRAISDRQERAQNPSITGDTAAGKGLTRFFFCVILGYDTSESLTSRSVSLF